MVYFFPLPYEDETLYSLISRYQVWSGNTNSKSLLRELYGKDTIIASKHMPSNINELKEHLPKQYPMSVERIINETTLYKYYLAFSDNEKAKIIYDYMVANDGSKIFATLGLSNNKITNINSLKYCKECVKEDVLNLGEAYWHREHQLPGIVICNKHKTSLFELDNRYIRNRQEFININHMDNSGLCLIEKIDEEIIKKQNNLSKNLKFILNSIYEHKCKDFFRAYYINRLVEIGIAEGKHKVNQEILHSRFIKYYGHTYLKLINCDLLVGDNNSWLTKITRKHRTFFHPLYHLLIIDFLGIDIVELFNSKCSRDVNKIRKANNVDRDSKYKGREKWLELIENYPQKTTSALRNIDCSTYTWLYRWDKQWLKENSPVRKRKQGVKQIDWNERDEVMLKKISAVVEDLLNSNEKPERITVGSIGRKIGEVYILQRYLEKIPRCKAYLEENVETLEQFQKRRVEWVKEKCFEEELVREWKVRRKAGIK